MGIVVLDVLGEHGLQMAAAEDERSVEALVPEGVLKGKWTTAGRAGVCQEARCPPVLGSAFCPLRDWSRLPGYRSPSAASFKQEMATAVTHREYLITQGDL